MNKLIITFVSLLIVVIAFFFFFDLKTITAGNVGVRFNLYAEKGVAPIEVGPGRYLLNFNEEMYTFPTFTQNYVWTADSRPGSEQDESILFSDIDGLQISTDIGITHRIDPVKVPILFQTYRRGIDEINDTFLRNLVTDALVRESSKLQVSEIYGSGKGELLTRVQKTVQDQVIERGIIVENLYWIGEMRLPQAVRVALNAKIEATQKAQQRENEVATARAEAEKVREEAKGVADANLIRAQAEAQSITIRGEALRNNPGLVELAAVEKWNGVLPVYVMGESVPLINLPQAK